MGGIIEAASGMLDRRQFTTTFLPVFGFVAGLVITIGAGVGWPVATAWWSGLDVETRILAGVLLLLVTLLIGQLVAAQRGGLIKFYEGYGWERLPFGAAIAARCAKRHAGSPRRALYPVDDEHLLPTELGNVLRGAEEHPNERYLLPGVTTWPRLYVILPEAFQQTFAAAAADLDLMVTVSGLGLAFAVVGGALAVWQLPWYGVLLCVWGGFLVGWLGYRGTVRSAGPYGQLFRAAFDVHRWQLLDSMGLRRPTSPEAEGEQWSQLEKLWVAGAVDSDKTGALGYPVADQPSAPAEDAKEIAAPQPDEPEAAQPEEAEQTVDTEEPPPAPNSRPLRIGPWLLVIAVLVGLVVALATSLRGTSTPPLTAAHALSPYHLLGPDDVRGTDADRVAGRYPLQPISAGAAVDPATLGPKLAADVLDGKAVVTVRLPADRLMAANAAPGVEVRVHLVTPGPDPKSETIPDVIVLDVSAGRRDLVLAVPKERLDRLLAGLDGSRVYLVTTS